MGQFLRVWIEVPQAVPRTPVIPEREPHPVDRDFCSFPNEGHGDPTQRAGHISWANIQCQIQLEKFDSEQ